MATIGRLTVALAANSAQLVQDLNKARKTHNTWANQVERRAKQTAKVIAGIGVAATAAFAAAGVAGLVMINRQARAIDEMAKTANNLRMDVSSFQRLSYVAEQSGNSVGELTGALQRMNQALASPTRATQEALAGIGLSVDQLMRMNPEERFRAIAQAINSTGSEARATAAQMALFGRSSGQMLNLLQADFESLNAEFDKMGIAISARQAAMVSAYQDAKGRLGTLINGFKMQFTAQMAEPMSKIVSFINEASEKMGGMDKLAAAAAASLIRGIAGVIQAVASLVDSLDDVIERFMKIELLKLKAEKQSETMNAPSMGAVGGLRNIFNGIRGLMGGDMGDTTGAQIRQRELELQAIQDRANTRQGAVDTLLNLADDLLSGVGGEFEELEEGTRNLKDGLDNAVVSLAKFNRSAGTSSAAWERIFGKDERPVEHNRFFDSYARMAKDAINRQSEAGARTYLERMRHVMDLAERNPYVNYDTQGMETVFGRLTEMLGYDPTSDEAQQAEAVKTGIDSSGIISEIVEGRKVFHDGMSGIQQVLEKQMEKENVKIDLNLTTDKGQLQGQIIASREMAERIKQIASATVNDTARGVAA